MLGGMDKTLYTFKNMPTINSAKVGKRKVNKIKYQDFYFQIKYALGCS